MKRFSVLFASVGAVVTALCHATSAHALGPVDIEIGARVGVATNPSSDFPSNPYGFGLGGRAGVSIFGIYGGISGMYYLGSSGNVLGVSESTHTAMYGFEVGYTLPIPVVKIRPQVGIGNSTFSTSVSGGAPGENVGGSNSNLYLEPGVLVMVPIGIMFVGADVNALILPSADGGSGSSKTYVSLSAHGQVGVRF